MITIDAGRAVITAHAVKEVLAYISGFGTGQRGLDQTTHCLCSVQCDKCGSRSQRPLQARLI